MAALTSAGDEPRSRDDLAALREAHRARPDDRGAWSALTDQLAASGDWSAVIELATDAAARFPDWAEPPFRAGVAAEALGDLEASHRYAADAVDRDLTHIGAQAVLGLRRVERGERLDGMSRLLEASQLSQHPFVLLRRAKGHVLAEQPEPAEYWLGRIIEADPGADDALALLAHLYEQTGRLDDAARTLDAIPERRGVALLTEAVVARRQGRAAEALELLAPDHAAALGVDPALAAVERGRSLDHLDRVDEAWDEFRTANRIARDRSSFDDSALGWFDILRDWWTAQSPERPHPNGPRPSRTPVAFVVGLPRSGTTLIEQLLVDAGITSTTECSAMATASAELAAATSVGYPGVLDEVGESGVSILRDAYWEVLARWLVPDGLPVLDKLPMNLLYLGSIDAAFPDTRIVMVRRDPRDVVLSTYFSQFVDNEVMALTTDLERIVDLFVGAMELWTEARPRLRVPHIEVRYEDLVADPSAELDRLGSFLGVVLRPPSGEWSGRLISTPSYADATGSINARSIGRWRRYANHLEPVLDRLEPWVRAHETLRA